MLAKGLQPWLRGRRIYCPLNIYPILKETLLSVQESLVLKIGKVGKKMRKKNKLCDAIKKLYCGACFMVYTCIVTYSSRDYGWFTSFFWCYLNYFFMCSTAMHLQQRLQHLRERERSARTFNSELLQQFDQAQDILREMMASNDTMKTLRVHTQNKYGVNIRFHSDSFG